MDNKINRMKEYFRRNFPEYEISLSPERIRGGDIECVSLKKDDDRKYIYYSHNLGRKVSNIIDGSYPITLPYGNVYTLNSYEVGDFVRSFIAITNVNHSEVYSIGYDLNYQQFMVFPIDDNGLIDDDIMVELIKQEKPIIGIDPIHYKRILELNNIYYIMQYLKVENGFKICNDLFEKNSDRIKELESISLGKTRSK